MSHRALTLVSHAMGLVGQARYDDLNTSPAVPTLVGVLFDSDPVWRTLGVIEDRMLQVEEEEEEEHRAAARHR